MNTQPIITLRGDGNRNSWSKYMTFMSLGTGDGPLNSPSTLSATTFTPCESVYLSLYL